MFEKLLRKLWERLIRHLEKHYGEDSKPPTPTPTPTPHPPSEDVGESNEMDEVPYEDLKWTFGGFDGKGKEPHRLARITDLRIHENHHLSYRWTEGGCEQLGAKDKGDAKCLACLFYHDGERWVGGKFDWISTSRTTRGFENILTGYEGWDGEGFKRAKDFAFVITSWRGNSYRTNVIRGGR